MKKSEVQAIMTELKEILQDTLRILRSQKNDQ